jgi:hypothetical protein
MTTYNDATVMPIPPREDKSIHTKVDPNFVLPDVHPVFKNVTFRTPKLENELIDYNEKLKQRAREDFVPITLGIRHGMLQLIEAVALKRPLWNFTATDFSGTYGFVTEFVVRQGGEELGKIRHELYYNGRSSSRTDKYNLYNHRISGKLDRKDHKTTTNIDTAIRTVIKEFGVKSRAEVIASAKEAVTQTAKDFDVKAERKARDAQWNVRASLMDTLIARPDVFKQFDWYEKEGAPCVEHTQYANMMAVMKSDVENLVGGKLVIQRDDTYIVVDNVNNVSYTHQTLPYEIRSKLGMLKLVEPNEFVGGIGFKSNQECFFIFVGEEHQHNEE